jgi:hypothetical protein
MFHRIHFLQNAIVIDNLSVCFPETYLISENLQPEEFWVREKKNERLNVEESFPVSLKLWTG